MDGKEQRYRERVPGIQRAYIELLRSKLEAMRRESLVGGAILERYIQLEEFDLAGYTDRLPEQEKRQFHEQRVGLFDMLPKTNDKAERSKIMDEALLGVGDEMMDAGYSRSERACEIRKLQEAFQGSDRGAPKDRLTTLRALDMHLARGMSYAQIADELCTEEERDLYCSGRPHSSNSRCSDRFRKRICEAQSRLEAWGFEFSPSGK